MILQHTTFICERCGFAFTETKQVGEYADPLINPPDGWDIPEIDPTEWERNPLNNCALVCPDCLKLATVDSRGVAHWDTLPKGCGGSIWA